MTRILMLMLVAGCGQPDVGASSSVVGGACSANSQCANQCVTDGHFTGGGICTRTCANDAGCPEGSACVQYLGSSGICAPTCKSASDCNAYGRGWACHKDDRFGAIGEVDICRQP